MIHTSPAGSPGYGCHLRRRNRAVSCRPYM
nr:MAG TPA: hypothetical protein [Caudoviricetes sp.]